CCRPYPCSCDDCCRPTFGDNSGCPKQCYGQACGTWYYHTKGCPSGNSVNGYDYAGVPPHCLEANPDCSNCGGDCSTDPGNGNLVFVGAILAPPPRCYAGDPPWGQDEPVYASSRTNLGGSFTYQDNGTFKLYQNASTEGTTGRLVFPTGWNKHGKLE